jgi:hypothetical protein
MHACCTHELVNDIQYSVFLPGSYASYILLGIRLRWDNFDGTMLPSYDPEEEEEGGGA